jgi:long-chain acyl-CoA synthetase
LRGKQITKTILLTGATGSLGTQIALNLIRETAHTVVVLMRAGDKEAAFCRLSRAWWDWPELVEALGKRVQVLVGDVSAPKLGLENDEYTKLLRTLTHIIHTAADLRLNAPIEELRKTNVGGTAHILELAYAVQKDHGLERLAHVSTAYVAGERRGHISEDSLSDECGFRSKYELSKYEGEKLVQQAKKGLPISVFRPGLIVGHSGTGAIKTFNTVYFPLRLYLTKKPAIIPIDPAMRVNLVPVDYVAGAVVRLTFLPEATGLNFHLVSPWERLPTARELLNFVRNFAREQMKIRIPRPLFLPLPVPATRSRYKAQAFMERDKKSILDPLLTIVPYFREKRHFLRDNVDRLLGPYDFRWPELLRPMVEYAVARGFMHRSERTVHEQVLYRLQSRSLPIVYHDIIEGKVITYDTGVVREQILAAAAALKVMGIGKGDRVALVGLNSVRYLILDVAIGLAGAASVPLYSTSPPAEIDQILASSRSRLLFMGTPGLLERLGELTTGIPIISICRQKPGQVNRQIILWEEFLAKGSGRKMGNTALVSFGDLATIRYTSGTTGQMKGACFDHQNLRWITESVCSVMKSWRAIDKEVSYLSYLPMSHIVEGILATYPPYYMRTPFNIYFLEDINGLLPALQNVRPHVFFTVPRFYQKVWETLLKSKLGRSYAASSKDPWKSLLRYVLRRGLLRKTGLNRCAHLVVGSAPISDDLLRDYRKLGIEVHNAYGLTEAPFVTMNLLGANRIGTVGEPVAGTELRIAADDGIMVRGPQVARGYLSGETIQPFEDGWLSTGDLGNLTQDNSLVIRGRKQEIIVTSYGKKIHPTKIEPLLKAVTNVTEAMLLGDGRPYCAAIFWVNPDAAKLNLANRIRQAILEINKQLSHPEQIRRWAILEHNLSIERGEITSSLKLKRGEVTRRLTHIIEALYSRQLSPLSGVLHICDVEEEPQPEISPERPHQ